MSARKVSNVLLRVQPQQGQAYNHAFRAESLTIGRSISTDLAIPDGSLSRRHARLFWNEDQLYLEDSGSRNGTLLNGALIAGPVVLAPGDRIQLSGTMIELMEIQRYSKDWREDTDSASQTLLKPMKALLQRDEGTSSIPKDDWSALRRYAERLMLVNEVHEAATSSMPLDELLALILDRTFGHLGPEFGAIYLRNSRGQFEAVVARSKNPANQEPLRPPQKLVTEVAEKGMAALVFDTQTDQRFSSSESLVSSGIRSLVAAPILGEADPLGMIVLSSKVLVRQFSEEDLNTLVSVASVAGLKIRNVQLVEEAAQRRVYQRELAIARRIQESLLPRSLPCPDGYQIEARNVPSQGVSGDFYLANQREIDGALVFLVADVSGKGIAASLLVGSLEALAAAPIEDGLPPHEVCEKLSRLLYARTSRERYATLFLGVLYPETGNLIYANAGHPAGLLLRNSGEVEKLGITGVPIGIFKEAQYQAAQVVMELGETLLVFSDGLIEARNQEGEDYSLERLLDLCKRNHQTALADLVTAIDSDWEMFAQNAVTRDDRTLLLLRRCKDPIH